MQRQQEVEKYEIATDPFCMVHWVKKVCRVANC
ncbi:hypothetical protein PFRI_07050 [Planktotalea frisia]|uniref:Uncharacterized protein n=1 Tax=Planktotalea frisia TaxID=696762 RepID=A0A1L9P0M4_9RHOB|nr:hypothetical protein PFRI_07050 [Planktotalea frisia]